MGKNPFAVKINNNNEIPNASSDRLLPPYT
jgi:hypothetical protein